ncbi:hypothetical protein [Bacillus cereus]|uniref:hypothetical protein n=1 Tax=Bacillus cereus TaxID=1396 RepID=UPI0018CCB2D1|nr:hypothetical protein [Bacillus cereus]MBG9617607.1 hypothetical protein [Bacillus cereus]
MSKIFQMDSTDYEHHAEILKVLAHPMRLLIIYKLTTIGSVNVFELQNQRLHDLLCGLCRMPLQQ